MTDQVYIKRHELDPSTLEIYTIDSTGTGGVIIWAVVHEDFLSYIEGGVHPELLESDETDYKLVLKRVD